MLLDNIISLKNTIFKYFLINNLNNMLEPYNFLNFQYLEWKNKYYTNCSCCKIIIYECYNLSEHTMERLFFDRIIEKQVIILAGSKSDREHCEKLQNYLKTENIYSKIYYCSAHKNTKGLLTIIDKYESYSSNICYVTIAGLSNALSGVVSCNTRFPVIACPPFSDRIDMFTNINSTLQCPSNVPVMTILNPLNVSMAVKRIFSLI
jgi:5-(carboxyamino)imidazole ribonucleotide mutase